MKDEVLAKAIASDEEVIPRYDIVLPDGTVFAQNAKLVLKNEVLTQGTPLNAQNLLSDDTSAALWLQDSKATPDEAFKAIRSSVGFCPRIQVNYIPGGNLYLTAHNVIGSLNGSPSTTRYPVPLRGQVTMDVPAYGEFLVWGTCHTFGNQNVPSTTTETLVMVDTVKLYTVELEYFMCQMMVFSAGIGTSVLLSFLKSDGNTSSIEMIVGDNNLSFWLPFPGKYTVTATREGCTSAPIEYEITEADNGTTIEPLFKWVRATIKATKEATISITDGSFTWNGSTTNKQVTVYLPYTGTFTVTADAGAQYPIVTQEFTATGYNNHTVLINF